MSSTNNYISEYYKFLKDNPDKANRKVLVVYRHLNYLTGKEEVVRYKTPSGENKEHVYIFDKEKASRPIKFIETFCRPSKGRKANNHLKLELFQKAFLSALFGFVDKESGLRKFTKALFYIGRKNGKTTLASGIALYCLTSDGEAGAEVYSIAKDREQAKIVWQEAKNMYKKSPPLAKRLRSTISGIYYDKTNSFFCPLASDSNSLDGKNTHCGIADEVHAWKDKNLLDTISDSMSAREQPLFLEFSTMGTVRESVFDNEYNYGSKVIDYFEDETGFEDPTLLPIIYELDDTKEYLMPERWYKANPALGSIKSEKYLYDKVERAKNNPLEVKNLLCKEFNVRQAEANTWLTFDELNNEEIYTDEMIKDNYAVGGVDLSSTTDLTCATLLIKKEGKLYVKQMYFIPEYQLDFKIKEDKIPYDLWKDLGWLRTSQGARVNYTDVTEWFVEQVKTLNIRPLWIGYDSWSAGYWKEEMEGLGFDLEEVRQGARTMSSPMKQMRADLIEKIINYNNNPILKWCLSNTDIKEDDNGNIRPVKKANRMRIDGTVSLIDAYVILERHQEDYNNLQGE